MSLWVWQLGPTLVSVPAGHTVLFGRGMWESTASQGWMLGGRKHSFSCGCGQSSMLPHNLKSGRLLVTGCRMLCILTWRSQADTLLGNGPHPVTWPLCTSEWPHSVILPLSPHPARELGNRWAPTTGGRKDPLSKPPFDDTRITNCFPTTTGAMGPV